MATLRPQVVNTNRISTHCWASGPDDGTPLLLVHGNLVSGRWFEAVAQRLPADVRVVAPDLRGFGGTDPLPVDPARGLRDWSDDVAALVERLGWAGQGSVHVAGWSLGGGVVEQYAIDHPADLASVTLLAPISPYGFGGTRGPDGRPVWDDYAGSGGGAVNPDFSARVARRDTSAGSPRPARCSSGTPRAAGRSARSASTVSATARSSSDRTRSPGCSPRWSPRDDGPAHQDRRRHRRDRHPRRGAWRRPPRRPGAGPRLRRLGVGAAGDRAESGRPGRGDGQPGAGLSDKPPAPYSIEQMADDVAAVVESCGDGPALVVGASMGGYIAMTLAVRRPDVVAGLVLVATLTGGPDSVPVPASTQQAWADNTGLPAPEFARATMPISLAPGWVERYPEAFERLLAARLENTTPPEAWRAQWDACERFLATGVPDGGIDVPTWVVHGTADRVVPYENAEAVQRRIPQAEVVTMNKCGHLCWLERPHVVNRLLVRAVEQL